jgi:hypothetical protein
LELRKSEGRAVAPHQRENTHFSMEWVMRTMDWVQVIFIHKRIISAIKRVEFVNDRMSYIILSGRWFHIIVLNVHTPTVDKTDDMKESFYVELERVIDKYRKHHTRIWRRLQCQSRQRGHVLTNNCK